MNFRIIILGTLSKLNLHYLLCKKVVINYLNALGIHYENSYFIRESAKFVLNCPWPWPWLWPWRTWKFQSTTGVLRPSLKLMIWFDLYFLQDSEAGQLYGLEKFWAFMKYYPHAEVFIKDSTNFTWTELGTLEWCLSRSMLEPLFLNLQSK